MSHRNLGVRSAAVARRLRLARVYRPYTLVFALTLPVPGVLAVVYGDDVSRALSDISVGVLSRIIGFALLIGGTVTLLGLARGDSLYEGMGLSLMSGACAVYGLGVILGLGLGGMIAGPISLALAVAMILRAVSLPTIARTANPSDE